MLIQASKYFIGQGQPQVDQDLQVDWGLYRGRSVKEMGGKLKLPDR